MAGHARPSNLGRRAIRAFIHEGLHVSASQPRLPVVTRAAPPSTGVDTITSVGIDAVLDHVQVAVDLANSPSFADEAVLGFFQTSGRNLVDLEVDAGVRHHVALTIVGAEPGFPTLMLAREARPGTADQRGRSAVHDRVLMQRDHRDRRPAAISFLT
jgi:hypothetical protein